MLGHPEWIEDPRFRANPDRVANQSTLYRQIEENENRKLDRVRGATAGAGAAPPAGHTIPEQIEKLDELRRRGVITEAEFQAKKTELLGRM